MFLASKPFKAFRTSGWFQPEVFQSQECAKINAAFPIDGRVKPSCLSKLSSKAMVFIMGLSSQDHQGAGRRNVVTWPKTWAKSGPSMHLCDLPQPHLVVNTPSRARLSEQRSSICRWSECSRSFKDGRYDFSLVFCWPTMDGSVPISIVAKPVPEFDPPGMATRSHDHLFETIFRGDKSQAAAHIRALSPIHEPQIAYYISLATYLGINHRFTTYYQPFLDQRLSSFTHYHPPSAFTNHLYTHHDQPRTMLPKPLTIPP